MYLSRLVVNRRSSAVRRDLADCQELHRTVMRCFPTALGPARVEHGVLYRLEMDRDGRAKLLVQSKVLPDWTRLPQNYLDGSAPDLNPATGSLQRILDGITPAARYQFRLVANPTRSLGVVAEDGKRKEKRVELRKPDEWYQWLERKGALHGFKTMRCATQPVPNASTAEISKVYGKRKGQELTIATVRFDGLLEVVDGSLFREAVTRGIGRSRAYGCGLLSIVRA